MKRRGVDGNSVASAAEFDRQMQQLGIALMRFEGVADRLYDQETSLLSMSIRLKGDGRADYLIVLRARYEGAAWVSFHSADTLAEAMRGMVARLENGSVKWKEDQYANE